VKAVTVVVPGPLTTRTGGSIYDRRIVEGLTGKGWDVTLVELDPIPHPLSPPLESAGPRFSELRDGTTVLIDGLAFGTMPEFVEREAWRLRFVPIVHMPLSMTPGLIRGESAWLSNLERRALKHARHVVITGQRTRTQVRLLTGWNDERRVARIPPGTDRLPEHRVPVRETDAPVRLLCVANLTPGKGYDILLRALAAGRNTRWTLACAGSDTRDPDYAACVKSLAHELGLASQVTWLGELDEAELREAHRDADLFVMSTRSETYGMAVADAIAAGVPVVSTRTGEIATLVGDGGLLAEPNDRDAFAAILDESIADPHLRDRLRAGARQAAARLPTWDEAVDAMADVLTKAGADD
jgi:glycosyltransferase involved in cell wall biosynthesis